MTKQDSDDAPKVYVTRMRGKLDSKRPSSTVPMLSGSGPAQPVQAQPVGGGLVLRRRLTLNPSAARPPKGDLGAWRGILANLEALANRGRLTAEHLLDHTMLIHTQPMSLVSAEQVPPGEQFAELWAGRNGPEIALYKRLGMDDPMQPLGGVKAQYLGMIGINGVEDVNARKVLFHEFDPDELVLITEAGARLLFGQFPKAAKHVQRCILIQEQHELCKGLRATLRMNATL